MYAAVYQTDGSCKPFHKVTRARNRSNCKDSRLLTLCHSAPFCHSRARAPNVSFGHYAATAFGPPLTRSKSATMIPMFRAFHAMPLMNASP